MPATALKNSNVGAMLLPDQEDLIALATERGIAFGVFANPRLAFAKRLSGLPPSKAPGKIHSSAVSTTRQWLAQEQPLDPGFASVRIAGSEPTASFTPVS